MDFEMIGLPYDKSQTFRKGAAKAPAMFRKIFPKVENFVGNVNLSDHFIEDRGDFTKKELEKLEIKKFPVFIGGDHSVTEWAVDKMKPKNVIIFDAHPDCEKSEGHDGIARRLAEKGYNVYLIQSGLRAMSVEERKYLDSGKVKVVDAFNLAKILGDTFVSVDFDVLDSSILPAVGNPEPSGMNFSSFLNTFRLIKTKIIGVDFVEYTPIEKDNDIYSSIAVKLIYNVMAELTRKQYNYCSYNFPSSLRELVAQSTSLTILL